MKQWVLICFQHQDLCLHSCVATTGSGCEEAVNHFLGDLKFFGNEYVSMYIILTLHNFRWVLCSVHANSHVLLRFVTRTGWEATLKPKTQTAQQYFGAVIPLGPHPVPDFWSRSPRVWAGRQIRLQCSKCGMRKMSQLSHKLTIYIISHENIGSSSVMLALCRTFYIWG